jgi:sugar O-acyltransferase (sialic acid O-acetyltransferase NeuD family)
MAKKLILYGASNFGDEIVQLFRDINKSSLNPIWEIVGFLDDNDAIVGKMRNGIPVLGSKSWLDNNDISEYFFVCCIGNPKIKSNIVSYLKSKEAKFATGIHPSVIISETSVVGEGTVITAGNIITTNIEIGNHIIINLACTIGHYTIIGDYSTINPGVNISGDVVIEEGVILGTNATIIEKKKIGGYSIVGAGSVVNKDIPSYVTAVGVPAKIIKKLD